MLMLPINANAANDNMINVTHNTPLIDGRCDADEWQTATKIALPAQTEVYLMHNNDALFVCAKGKANDYTVIDLYIEDADTGKLYNLHASAQLTERVFVDKKWSESVFWNHKDWSGFWVPYAGEKETEEGKRTLFLEGSHREIQVLRKKFPHKRWQMMFRISAVNHNGKYGAEFFYPQQAKDTDKSTWAKFTFAQ
ncbi:hypothetical protein [Thalassotalea sediminis]|uniref:hypothetical protein n=1 Tax=Thalassotalea sediminis TaxID=1759089 RepID=UPI0025742743|nr:hypothetical protein [Thalassotalea sediminis]